jgi:hypothetical protein
MRRLAAALATCATCLLTACGGPSDETPVACLEGAGPYLAALAESPGEVRLADDVPISDCLAENQTGGDLATVGTALVATATKLDAEGRSQPRGSAPLQLGYLIGAARRGAGETSGIHADLLRRLEAAARYSPGARPLPEDFRRAYRQGLAAGRKRG